MQPDTWYAYFHIRGSFDPDDITRELGITPTETGREGENVSEKTSTKRKCSLWALHSRLDSSSPLEKHIEDVLDQLDVNKAAVKKASQALDGTMQLVGCFREVRPGIHFDQETVRRCAGYALSIDCDFYIG